jgi:predicted nucleotide-binding protein
MSNPRLFIGSSTESLPLAEVLAKGLEDCAEVVLWNTVFDPQKTYLTTLLRIPESYDFALFVLGPDDGLLTRGKMQLAPRDNVVFEFGLFLQVLGIERTFPVVPKM